MPKAKWSPILDYKVVPWWKYDNLLMSFDQLIESGLMGNLIAGPNKQLRLWIKGRIREHS